MNEYDNGQNNINKILIYKIELIWKISLIQLKRLNLNDSNMMKIFNELFMFFKLNMINNK